MVFLFLVYFYTTAYFYLFPRLIMRVIFYFSDAFDRFGKTSIFLLGKTEYVLQPDKTRKQFMCP